MNANYDVIVIGAGAAGLFAASAAAQRGRKTLLLEKNPRAGVKILMSGGTRCNITQAGEVAEVAAAFGRRQGQFLRSAFAGLPPEAVVELVHNLGVATKVEPGGKVFPESDRAADVLDAFLTMLNQAGAELALNEPVVGITQSGDRFMVETARRSLQAESVVLTVGGKSYPGSGTAGDGYPWAQQLGHLLVDTHAALTPITTRDAWVPELSGVTVGDVVLAVQSEDGSSPYPPKAKRLERDPRRRGSMLLTHFGLSGPAPLDVSRAISQHPSPQELQAICDWLPTQTEQETESAIQAVANQRGGKNVAALLSEWLPRRLAEQLAILAELPEGQSLAELSRDQRKRVIAAVHRFEFRLHGVRGYKKAEVTMGGVALGEVDSRTLQSKKTPGLFFAGEILDIDGPIGGYNFQAAFATGRLAGEHA